MEKRGKAAESSSYKFLSDFCLEQADTTWYYASPSLPMLNNSPTQLLPNSVPRHDRRANGQRSLLAGRQVNPAPNPAPPASPQPAPPQKDTRTAPKKAQTKDTHRSGNRLKKDIQLNLWVRPVVKAELERVAKREGISISSAGEAFLEHALQTDMHTQHTTLLDTVIDKAIGRHMRTYSDRNAGLQARTIQKTEMVFQMVTNILARMPGMDESHMERILNDADDAARGSIKRMTPKDKHTVAEEKAQFEKGSGGA